MSEPFTVQDISNLTSVTMYERSRRLFVEFDAFPNALRKKKLYGAKALFCVDLGDYHSGTWNKSMMLFYPSAGAIDPATLTWSNQPYIPPLSYLKTVEGVNDGDVDFNPAGASAEYNSELAKLFVAYHTGAMENAGPYIFNTARLRTLQDGTSLPYVEITYDDSTNATSKVDIKTYPSGTINASQTQLFEWELIADTYWCADGFTQQSASLFWKESTESN